MPDEKLRNISDEEINEIDLLLPPEEFEYQRDPVFAEPMQTKLYKRRWGLLLLLACAFTLNGFQNIQYSGLQTSIRTYYKVSATVFDLLTQLYYIAFVVLSVPAMWLMKRIGLRWTVVAATVTMLTGESLCFVATFRRYLLWVAALGQMLNGVAQVFLMSSPVWFSVTWFEPERAATASGVLLFCYQLGNGMALMVSPVIVPPSTDMNFLKHRLFIMFSFLTIYSAILALLSVSLFPAKPPLPPSLSQALISDDEDKITYINALKILLKDCQFIKVAFSYGLNAAAFNAITTFIGPDILKTHPKVSDTTAGEIGASMIFIGSVGMVISGFILDRTKAFLLLIKIENFMCVVSAILFTLSINSSNTWSLWTTSAFLGYFLSSFGNTGSQIAAELTYPISESYSTSVIMTAQMAFSMIHIAVMRQIMKHMSVLGSNIYFTLVLFVGYVLICTVHGEMKRTAAEKMGH